MSDITKIKVADEPESNFKLYPRNSEFAKRSDVQPDWNQNDVSAPDYVKNRTHWEDPEILDVIFQQDDVALYDATDFLQADQLLVLSEELVVGDTYNVNIDGVDHYVVCYTDQTGKVYLGKEWPDRFMIFGNGSSVELHLFNFNYGSTVRLTVTHITPSKIHKLDPKYLPDTDVQPDWNQNDETAADYVKNRTHYEGVVLGAPTTYSSLIYTGRSTWGDAAAAKALVYAFDSVNLGFTNSAVLQSNTRTGNTRTLVYAIGSGTLEIVAMADEGRVITTNNTTKSQKCLWEYPSTVEVVVHPLDKKYIPDDIARVEDIPFPASAKVGQTIVVKAVDSNGKPTAWQAADMPSGGGSVPKPLTYDYMPEGYPSKAMGTITLMEEQEIAFVLEDRATYAAYPNETPEIAEGQTYTVNWDGTEYECVCTVLMSTILSLGNKSIYGNGDDTGEPFLYIRNQGTGTFATLETTASHTISVKRIGEIVIPMANEFLPVASEDNYGVVKKSEIVTSYKFDISAPHDQMVDAITAFKTGNASIVWAGANVIYAYYNSSDDTVTVAFAMDPLHFRTYTNVNGLYQNTLGSSTYGELQGNKVRITNDDGVYTVLSVKRESGSETLNVTAERISIGSIYGISTTEMTLKSSTSGSTKKFKITVDDSGTLKATEVT